MNCEYCGKEILPRPYSSLRKYCSERCQKKAGKKRYALAHPDKIKEWRRNFQATHYVKKPIRISFPKKKEAISLKPVKQKKDRKPVIRKAKDPNGERAHRERSDPTRALKEKSRQKLRWAVKKGEIIKPTTCQKCGLEKRLYGHHHKGYDRPLDVVWLCSKCHAEWHSLNSGRLIR